MTDVWLLAALWLGLALTAALVSIHLRIATALSEIAEKARGFALGAVDYITKPFQIEEVQAPVLPGDRIFLFTDGLIELAPKDGSTSRKRGLEALCQAAEETRGLALHDQVQAVANSLVRNASRVSDDILLLGVEV